MAIDENSLNSLIENKENINWSEKVKMMSESSMELNC